MDVEHNACMLGRAGWPARLRGALIHTHTEHNHTCGELENMKDKGSRLPRATGSGCVLCVLRGGP